MRIVLLNENVHPRRFCTQNTEYNFSNIVSGSIGKYLFHDNSCTANKTIMIYVQLFYFSAGIGRTGTFIVLDMLTYEGEDRGSVDIFGSVAGLRYQRCNMVQTPVFTFLLIEIICFVSTAYSSLDMLEGTLIWLCVHLISIPQNYWELHFGSHLLARCFNNAFS